MGTGKGTELSGDFSGKQQRFGGNSSRSDWELGIDPISAGISAGRAGMPKKSTGMSGEQFLMDGDPGGAQ